MIIEDIVAFLGSAPPFCLLSRSALRRLAGKGELVFHPVGRVLTQDGAEGLLAGVQVVRKGTMRVTAHDGSEEAVGPGTCFGWYPGGGARQAMAVTDVLCLSLPVASLQEMLDQWPEVGRLLRPRMDATLTRLAAGALRRRSAGLRLEHVNWQHAPLHNLVSHSMATVPEDASLAVAARCMTEEGSTAVVVMDEAGRARGILTDRDLRTRVVGVGLPVSTPVRLVMSTPVFSLEGATPCLEALFAMTMRHIHHVVVTDGGEAVGVVSGDDFAAARGASPAALLDAIRSARTLTELVGAARRLDDLAADLLCEGGATSLLLPTMGALHDLLTLRLIDMAQESLGPAPVPYAFVVFGVAARQECLHRPTQCNGIVYEGGDAIAPDVARYFANLGDFVVCGLAGLGFARCANSLMASAPQQVLPISAWCERYGGATPLPEALHDVRVVAGDAALGRALAAAAMGAVTPVCRGSGALAGLVRAVRTLAHARVADGAALAGVGATRARLQVLADAIRSDGGPGAGKALAPEGADSASLSAELVEEAASALELLLLDEAHAALAERMDVAVGEDAPVVQLARRRAHSVVARMVACGAASGGVS